MTKREAIENAKLKYPKGTAFANVTHPHMVHISTGEFLTHDGMVSSIRDHINGAGRAYDWLADRKSDKWGINLGPAHRLNLQPLIPCNDSSYVNPFFKEIDISELMRLRKYPDSRRFVRYYLRFQFMYKYPKGTTVLLENGTKYTMSDTSEYINSSFSLSVRDTGSSFEMFNYTRGWLPIVTHDETIFDETMYGASKYRTALKEALDWPFSDFAARKPYPGPPFGSVCIAFGVDLGLDLGTTVTTESAKRRSLLAYIDKHMQKGDTLINIATGELLQLRAVPYLTGLPKGGYRVELRQRDFYSKYMAIRTLYTSCDGWLYEASTPPHADAPHPDAAISTNLKGRLLVLKKAKADLLHAVQVTYPEGTRCRRKGEIFTSSGKFKLDGDGDIYDLHNGCVVYHAITNTWTTIEKEPIKAPL